MVALSRLKLVISALLFYRFKFVCPKSGNLFLELLSFKNIGYNLDNLLNVFHLLLEEI